MDGLNAFVARHERWIIGVCALLFFLQAGFAAQRKSLTWDEPTFIVSGLSYWQTGDFHINAEAPPLPQLLYGLPLLFLDITFPDYDHPDFAPEGQVRFARAFVSANASGIGTIATLARLPTWLMGAALVWLIGRFTSRLAGPTAGITGALLAALSPNLLAHGRLATSDLACALTMFAAVYAFYLALYDGGRGRWTIAGLACGGAILSKFTALLLGPILATIALWEWRAGRVSLSSAIPGILILKAAALLALTLGYFGRPWRIIEAIATVYWNATPGYQYYLFGIAHDTAVWYYHFAALLIKTPVPTLVLIGIASWLAVTRRMDRRVLLYALVPVAIVLVVATFDRANLGLRRILPIYPFLFLFIGAAMSVPSTCTLCRRVHAALIACCALVALVTYPHHLSFFNTLVGGPSRGPYLMDDSNVDWGQDLPALRAWQRAHPNADPIRLQYFGTVDPDVYGVHHLPIPESEIVAPKPGLYAISAHHLVFIRKVTRKAGRPDLDWLDRFTPIDRAGPSIWIYRME